MFSVPGFVVGPRLHSGREAGPCAEAVAEVLGTSPSTFLSIRISLLNHSRMVPFLDMPDEIGSRRTSPLCYLRTASSGMHGRGGSTNVVYYDLIQTGTMRPKGAKICSSRPCCACTQSHIAPICCQTSVQPAAHTNSAHSAMLSCHGRSPALEEMICAVCCVFRRSKSSAASAARSWSTHGQCWSIQTPAWLMLAKLHRYHGRRGAAAV